MTVRFLPKNEAVAETIALVSIVAGAAVAVLVPFISARLEQSRLTEQRENARFEELRGLLDDAVKHLLAVRNLLLDIEGESKREPPRPEWSESRLLQLVTQLSEQTGVMSEDDLRMRLRLPEGSAIYDAYRDAKKLIGDYERKLRAFSDNERREQEKPPAPPRDGVDDAIGALIAAIRDFVGVVELT
jgi:hypothetical protein